MGFCNFQSRNYIDLLNLPKNFKAFVQNALPVSEDWEIPIDCANMLDYLKRFFAGHGGNSLISKLNALRQSFNIAYTQLAQGSVSFKEITETIITPLARPEFEELLTRWKNYYPYFEYLPFYPTMQEINGIILEISEYFACNYPTKNLFLEKAIEQKLNHIHQQLLHIDKPYIRPEIYSEKPSLDY